MKIPILVLILTGIPEQIATVVLAFILARVKLQWKKIFIMGTILAVSAYIMRTLPITFGVHTIVNIGLLIFLMHNFVKVDLTPAVISSIITYLILIIVETLIYLIVLPIFDIPMGLVADNISLRLLLGGLLVLILVIISIITNIFIKRKR